RVVQIVGGGEGMMRHGGQARGQAGAEQDDSRKGPSRSHGRAPSLGGECECRACMMVKAPAAVNARFPRAFLAGCPTNRENPPKTRGSAVRIGCTRQSSGPADSGGKRPHNPGGDSP